jgi:hypothetical protein
MVAGNQLHPSVRTRLERIVPKTMDLAFGPNSYRDCHQLSHFEIGGEQRISRHLFQQERHGSVATPTQSPVDAVGDPP